MKEPNLTSREKSYEAGVIAAHVIKREDDADLARKMCGFPNEFDRGIEAGWNGPGIVRSGKQLESVKFVRIK